MPKYQRRFRDRVEDRDPSFIWMEMGDGHVVQLDGQYAAVGERLTVVREADILLHTHLITFGDRVDNGRVVSSFTPGWTALRGEVLQDPSLFEYFPKFHRKFEEFLAGTYRAAHWSDVILTPRSGDKGYDIAARKRGRRILDEAKAYKSTLFVGHCIVRAALGLIEVFKGVSDVDQVRVTTTSSFAPLVRSEFGHLIPDRLALRDRRCLLRWLDSIRVQID